MSARPVVGIVDYGMGNRRSVEKALELVGAEARLTSDAARLASADGLVVPGVGAFPRAMERLAQAGLDGLIRERAAAGVPVLGICLGMQLLFESSEEIEPAAGLGLIAGRVRRLANGTLRLPHIGWNDVRFQRRSPLTEGLPAAGCPFYHVHSYVADPADSADVVATASYGETFATIVARENVLGAQFHPEKSSADGLALLANFTRLCRTGSRERSPLARAAR